MPELPWEKWYPTNWASEPGLRLCRPSTRGIWFEAINTMMLAQTYVVSGTMEDLCGLLACLPVELKLAMDQLKKQNVADVSEQNGNIILISRKRKRDCEIRDLRKKAGIASGTKRKHNPQQDVGTKGQQDVGTRSASASASASASVPEGGAGGNAGFAEQPSWDEFWEFCKSPHCGLVEWFARDKFLAQEVKGWSDVRDWRKFALRVRGWWDNEGRPMTPRGKNCATTPVIHRLRDSVPPEEVEAE